MWKNIVQKLFRLLMWSFMLILVLIFLLVALPRLVTAWSTRNQVFTVESAPVRRAAIVFGAGLWRDGSPTPVLRDRVATAAQLYFAGKVEKLLMSGDNSYIEHNEPGAMRGYALELGVPDEAIVLDYAGRRTYDTCYRAKAIFGLQEAILVTQKFHLPRALYLCNALGLPAVGVPADRQDYRKRSLFFWNLREVPATLAALWDVNVTRPRPILGKPEPIFPMEAQ
jgi:SanA protein